MNIHHRQHMFQAVRVFAGLPVCLLFLCLAASSALAAWTPPSEAPPSGNVAAPLNTANINQTKLGSLTIGGEYLALPIGGLFFSHTPELSRPHINVGSNRLYLSPGDGGDYIELQGRVHITQAGSNYGELTIQNLAGGGCHNAGTVKADDAGRLYCDTDLIGDQSLWKTGLTANTISPLNEATDKVAIGRGDIGDNTQLSIRNAGVSANDKALYAEQAGTAGWAGYFSGRVTFMDGRVGINTTDPQEQLHVNGTIRTSLTNCVYLKTDANGNITCPTTPSNPPIGGWFPLGEGLNGEVRIMAIFEGRLYIGGDFTASGSTTLNHIAEWTGTGWQPVGAGTNGPVNTMYAFNGSLWVGGNFTQAGGVARTNLALWDGSAWVNSPSNAYPNGPLYAIHLDGNCLKVGGYFTAVGGLAARDNAEYCTNVSSWFPIVEYLGPVYDEDRMAWPSSNRIIGGAFTHTASGCQYGLVWDDSHSAILHCLQLNGAVYAMLPTDSNETWMGGGFSTSTVQRLGRFTDAGTVSYNAAANGPVKWLTQDSLNRIIAVGDFTAIGGFGVNRIARYESNNWVSYGSGANGMVNTAINYNGDLYAGGLFTNIGGTDVNNVAYWRE